MRLLVPIVPILGILSTIALPIGLGLYIAIRSINTRHKERMALIEQGIIPPEGSQSTPNKYRSLRNGILMVGIAIGLIISLIISYRLDLDRERTFLVIAPSVLLFLGTGYLLFYFLVRNKEEFQEDSEQIDFQ